MPLTVQAQTLLWARERQLARLRAITEGREAISVQVCAADLADIQQNLCVPVALTCQN